MKCLVNGLEVMYPCSHNCPLYGDCMVAFDAVRKSRVRTNADRIRAMSDEELAQFIQHIRTNTLLAEALGVPVSREKDLEYVRQPVKDGEGEW